MAGSPRYCRGVVIPYTTLSHCVTGLKAESLKKGLMYMPYLDMFKCEKKSNPKMLMSEEDRNYLEQLISLFNLNNNVMYHQEVIGVIQTLTIFDFYTAEAHWYYLRSKKLLPELKNHRTLRTAKSTITKRSGVITEKLLWLNMTIETTLKELDWLNGWHADWASIQSSQKINYFWENSNETNMSASYGKSSQIASFIFTRKPWF